MMERMNGSTVTKEYIRPVAVKAKQEVLQWENLLISKPACVSFRNDSCCAFTKRAHTWCWILARSFAVAYV